MSERYKPIFEEQVFIGTTAGTTYFTLSTVSYANCEKVKITLINSNVTYSFINTPTTVYGHIFVATSSVDLHGKSEIFGFKAVAGTITVGSTGSALYVTGYEWIG